jgi:pimeloyl-ACP methyl ester carboxylesterase
MSLADGQSMSWTERSGVRIAYSVEGSGPPLVLLHGLGTSSELWRVGGYAEALRDRHQLILIDARGHGDSAKPTEIRDYDMPNHAADVVAVLDDLEIESASYLGFSLGGATALVIAGQYPDRTNAVATIGTTPSSAEFADGDPINPAGLVEQAGLFESSGMEWLAELLEAEGRPHWAALMRKSDGRPQALQCRSEADPAYARPLLSDVRAPILMFLGEHEAPEPMPPLPGSARVIVIPGADHAGGLEATNTVVPAVLAFLKDHPTSATQSGPRTGGTSA